MGFQWIAKTMRALKPGVMRGESSMENPDWNMDALVNVEEWLRKYIRGNLAGGVFNIGEVSRLSRGAGHILPRGNVEGVRHLLGKLEGEGYVKLDGRKHFRIIGIP